MNPQRSVNVPAGRRELLWNVSEPGDPYDIKRSMIAKMPGDKKIFMGNHLQLICLLQAAEIQRLCQFLDDYKLKFRQVQRSNLDRHSYEIQIKELTQRSADEESCRGENVKLVEFIKRQQAEIQYLQGISRDSGVSNDGLKQTYERSLQMSNKLTNQNVQLRQHLEEMRVEMGHLRGRYEAMERAKSVEIEHLKTGYAQNSREDYETGINSLKMQYESEIRKYDMEAKRLKELNDAKNAQINDLMQQREQLARRLNTRQSDPNLQKQIYEYENKFVMFGQQIQRLNIALRDYTNKLQESDMRRRQLQRSLEQKDFERKDVEGRLQLNVKQAGHLGELVKRYEEQLRQEGQSKQYMDQYEYQIAQLQRQNSELTQKLKKQSQLSKRYKQEADKLNFQNSRSRLLERENSELRNQTEEFNIIKRKVVEYENRIAILKEEMDRLQSIIRTKDGELERARPLYQENQANKSRLREVESTIVSKYEYEMSRLKSDYESKIELVTRSKGDQWQGKSQHFESQAQKLKEALRLKTEEGEKQRKLIYELENLTSRNDLEWSTKIRNYEGQITAMKRQNQEFFNKTKALGQNEKRVYELQNKLQQADRQIQRLSQGAKVRQDEIISLRNRLRQTEGETQNSQGQLTRQIAIYQQNINNLRVENEDLKRKVNDSNRRLSDAAQQMQRLGQNIRKSLDEKNQLQQSMRQLSQKSAIDNEDLIRKIAEYEGKVNNSSVHVRGVEQDNQNLRRQLLESKQIITRWEGEAKNLSNNMEQSLGNAGRENENLRKRISEYEIKLTQLSQQLIRLNEMLRAKGEECSNLQARYRTLDQQYENAKRQFKQYELSVKSKVEGQLLVTINNLKGENDELRKKLTILDGEHNKKSSMYETSLTNINRSHEDLQRKLQELDMALRKKTEECGRFESQLKSRNGQMENMRMRLLEIQQQNETLKRRLDEVGGDSSRRIGEFKIQFSQLNIQFDKAKGTINLLNQQNDVLKRKIEGYELSIANYQIQVKRRFQQAEQNLNNLKRQNQDLRRKLTETSDMGRRLSESDSKIVLLSQEIERLHGINEKLSQDGQTTRRQLMQKTSHSSQYELQISRRLQNYEQNMQSHQRDNVDLKKKINQYQQRLHSLSQQLQRVNTAYRTKTDQLSNMERTFKLNHDQVVSQFTRDNEDLNRKLREHGDVNKRCYQFENQVVIMNQEIQRLQENLRSKHGEIQSWRKRYSDLQNNSRQKLEVEVTQKYASYEQKIIELKSINAEYQNKLRGTIQEIQRLNNVLRLKTEEAGQLTIKVNGLMVDLEECARRLREAENVSTRSVDALRGERDDLMRKNQEWDSRWRQNELNNERRTAEHESQLRARSQELQKEIEIVKFAFKEFQDKHAFEIRSSTGQYESKIEGLGRQNYEHKRRITEYESKLGQMSQELDKLSSILRTKTEELNRFQLNHGNLTRDHEQLRKKYQESSDINRRIAEYEMKLAHIIKENEKLQNVLAGKTEELNSANGRVRQKQGELEALRRQISEYQGEVKSRVSGYQQGTAQLRRDNQDLGKRRTENESKIALLSQQLQRVNGVLNRKNEDYLRLSQQFQSYKRSQQSQFQQSYRTLQQKYAVMTNEYQVAKQHLIDYEASIRKLHAEFERLQSILQELKRQRDSLIEKNRVLSEEIKRLNGLNTDLQEQTREVRLRLSDETSLQKRISEHLSLMVVLFAQIETLRHRVREKEIEVVQVRKSSLLPHMV